MRSKNQAQFLVGNHIVRSDFLYSLVEYFHSTQVIRIFIRS